MKSDKEYLLKGSLINSLGLITRTVSPFLVILLARFYPQKEFGLFVSLQALVYTLSRLAILGLDKGLLWHIPRMARDRTGRTSLSDSLWVTLAISSLLFAIGAVFAATGWLNRMPSFQGVEPSFFLIMTAAIFPFAAVQLFSGALDGVRQPQYRVFLGTFLATSLVPLIAFLLKGPMGNAASLGWGMFLAYAIGALLFLPALRRHFSGEPWFSPSRPPPELIRYSLPLAGSELVVSLLLRLDLWMVLLLLGPEKAAVYAVMVTLANGLRTVRQTFEPLLVPIVSGLKDEELQSRLRPSFSYATNMVSTLQLSIACVILVFPREILSLAGKQYSVEIFAFAILLLGNLVNGFLGLNGIVLLGMGLSRIILAITTITLILTLFLNWLLIPRIGIAGAALAATIGMLFQNVVHTLLVRFRQGLRLYEPHLYQNAVLEIAFLALFFLAYPRIAAMPLADRIGIFLLLALALGTVVFLKRKTFSMK